MKIIKRISKFIDRVVLGKIAEEAKPIEPIKYTYTCWDCSDNVSLTEEEYLEHRTRHNRERAAERHAHKIAMQNCYEILHLALADNYTGHPDNVKLALDYLRLHQVTTPTGILMTEKEASHFVK